MSNKLQKAPVQDHSKKNLIDQLMMKNQATTEKTTIRCMACYAGFDR